MLVDFTIFVLTWNVKSSFPEKNLNQLLEYLPNNLNSNFEPSAYAIGFQEVAGGLFSYFYSEPWTVELQKALGKRNYVKIREERLNGILFLLFVKKNYLIVLRDIDSSFTKIGFGGWWGNKGAIGLSIKINKHSLCLINSHLAAHDHQFDQRVREFETIYNRQSFKKGAASKIFLHDYVIWLGDLNFRLDELHSSQIINELKKAKISPKEQRENILKDLLTYDQLLKARKRGIAFHQFSESIITFLATYKFTPNSDSYDLSRRPAWCDRILFQSNRKDNQSTITSYCYTCHNDYKQSDHKPVLSIFSIKIDNPFASPQKDLTSFFFSKVQDWKLMKNQSAWLNVQNIHEPRVRREALNVEGILTKLTKFDWVGLYPADFTSLDEYTSYVWLNINNLSEFTLTSDEDSSQADGITFSTNNSNLILKLKIEFDGLILLCPGDYRLVYIDKDENVRAMSNVFKIKP